jgi:hypothetical protein
MRNATRFVAVAIMVLGGAAGALPEVVIETVTVGNPGNAHDTHGAGYGGVGYVYNIGKFRLVEVPQPECITPPFGMVAWWPFWEPVGPTAEDIVIGGDHHGTYKPDENGPTPVSDGMVGRTLSFDGEDDYVEVSNVVGLDFGMGEGTIDAWIKTEEDGGGGSIVVKGWHESYSVGVMEEGTAHGKVFFAIADDDFCYEGMFSEGTVNDGDWHHVAATLSRSEETDGDVTLDVYIDGVWNGRLDLEGVGYVGYTDEELLIGATPYGSGGGWRFFDGVMDEIEIFNRALAQEEIQAIFDAGSAGKCRPAEYFEMKPDIKPGACPNLFNRHSHGVLPVALMSTDEVGVTQVDISTLRMSRADGVGDEVAPHEGPPGPHSVFEDAGTPFDGEPCDCHDLEGDGIIDLMMHFKTDDVVANLLLDDLDAGALVELVVTGNLLDGTPFAASDCVRLVPPGTAPGLLTVQSSVPGAWVDVSPLDETLDGGGFTDFERTFPLTTVVTLTAERSLHGQSFVAWQIDGEMQEPGENTVQFVMDGSVTVKALYRTPVFWSPRQMGAETPLPGADAP